MALRKARLNGWKLRGLVPNEQLTTSACCEAKRNVRISIGRALGPKPMRIGRNEQAGAIPLIAPLPWLPTAMLATGVP